MRDHPIPVTVRRLREVIDAAYAELIGRRAATYQTKPYFDNGMYEALNLVRLYLPFKPNAWLQISINDEDAATSFTITASEGVMEMLDGLYDHDYIFEGNAV
jgi:hypothetical protein